VTAQTFVAIIQFCTDYSRQLENLLEFSELMRVANSEVSFKYLIHVASNFPHRIKFIQNFEITQPCQQTF